MNLRPDEQASLSRIEREKDKDKYLKKGAGLALGAGTAALGLGATSRILPFLNEFIPADLAIKGISKISPEVGKFLKKGQSIGLDIKEGLNFIKEKMKPQDLSKQPNPLQDFEMNNPEIIQALTNQINNGRSPQEAALILKTSTPLSKKIKKIEKETGKNFVDYILELFGGNQNSQSHQPQQMQPQDAQGIQGQGVQQGQGLDPQLAQIMQGIRGTIQGLRGGNG